MRIKALYLKLKGLKMYFFIPIAFAWILIPISMNALSVSSFDLKTVFDQCVEVLQQTIPVAALFWVGLLLKDCADGEIKELIYPYEMAYDSKLPETLMVLVVFFIITIPDFFLLNWIFPGREAAVLTAAGTSCYLLFFFGALCYIFIFLTGRTIAGIILPLLYYSGATMVLKETPLNIYNMTTAAVFWDKLWILVVIMVVLFALGFVFDRKIIQRCVFKIKNKGK